MATFLSPASGGIQPINGRAGSIIGGMSAANQAKPGGDIIINIVNAIVAAATIVEQILNCSPQAQQQRVQQRLQQQVQQQVRQLILQNIQQEIRVNQDLQNVQQQMQSLRQLQTQEQSEFLKQQIQIVEQESQQLLQKIIVGAIGKAAQQAPQAAKIANSVSAGLKPIAAVAESLSTFVPSQGINMKNYGSAIKTVQTVSQSCFL